jgi:hypothetical protein
MQTHFYGRQNLPDLVVKLTRDSAALILLSFD